MFGQPVVSSIAVGVVYAFVRICALLIVAPRLFSRPTSIYKPLSDQSPRGVSSWCVSAVSLVCWRVPALYSQALSTRVPATSSTLCHALTSTQKPSHTHESPFVVLRALDIPSAIPTATSTLPALSQVHCMLLPRLAMMPPYQREGGVC